MSNLVTKPRVSIGMPVYNGERYLEETLRANLAQTYEDFELIIADNASTDRTSQICQDFAASDARIKYLQGTVNVGAPGNYTRCFEPSVGEYFRWANVDDLPALKSLECCVSALDQHSDTVLVYGKTKIIDEQGELLELYDDMLDLQEVRASERFLRCLNNIGLSNVLFGLMRRESLVQTALIGNYQASDINLIVELTLYGKFRELPGYLFSRRMHPGCSSWDRSEDSRQVAFWDPSKPRLLMQTWRAIYEYFKAVYRAPIPLSDKRRLNYYLCKKVYWAKASLALEAQQLIKYKLGL